MENLDQALNYFQNKDTVDSALSYFATKHNSQTEDPTSLIQKYFPQNEWERAKNVMLHESGGKADAIGDNFPIRGQTIPSVGLFQIRTLPGRPSAQQLSDPDFNVKYAAQMFKEQGWGPWTAAHKLGYVK
jgi:hypothetical protein